MQNSNDKARDGFVKIPNALIDNPNVCARDKLVLLKVASHAYGKSVVAYPSQAAIADSLGYRRETVRAALASLAGLGVLRPHGEGRQGKQERFTIDLDRAANLTIQSPGNLTTQSPSPGDSVAINKTAELRLENKTPADSSEPPAIKARVERGDIDGRSYGNCSAAQGPDDSVVRFTNRQINELMLTPNLKLPDDEPDALFCNLDLELGLAGGKVFNRKVLEELVALRGDRFVAFWTSWLLRKIAAEYEAGRPVTNPSGLFTEAVRGGWKVDQRWPEFDESKPRLVPVAGDDYFDDLPF